MSVIVAIRSQFAVVVGSDAQLVSSAGRSEAPFDKTFQSGALIGVHCGLSSFAGLEVKAHLAKALGDRSLSPQDSVRKLSAYMRPILKAVSEDEVSFKNRHLDIIIASRTELASVSLAPNLETKEIYSVFNENELMLTAGTHQAKRAVIKHLPRRHEVGSHRIETLNSIVMKAIEAAIDAGVQHPRFPEVPSCCRPVYLRHIQ